MQVRKLRISALGFCSFLAISGCSGGGSHTTTTSTGGSATTPTTPTAMAGIYVLNNGVAFTGEPLSPTTILVYPKTANGAVAPTTVITAPANFSCAAIAVDSAGNVYLGGVVENAAYGGQTILVYAPGASTPTRTIAPAEFANSQSTINSLAVDGSGNIYVAGNPLVGNTMTTGVAEYASTATGSASATRVISGAATTIPFINQIAVDSAGNLYIAPFQAGSVGASILIFNSMATGNVAPTATLGGPSTGIYDPGGVAVDKAGNIYVDSEAANISTPTGTFPGADSIVVFTTGSTGNVVPTRTISGSATMLERRNLAVDTAGNVYTVTGFAQVIAFSPTATGNVAPSAVISSSAGAASFDSYVIATF